MPSNAPHFFRSPSIHGRMLRTSVKGTNAPTTPSSNIAATFAAIVANQKGRRKHYNIGGSSV